MRRATHAQRLKLAEEICNEIKGVLRNDLRAFVIFASCAKNEDGPYSDLEMMAITTDQYEERYSEFMRDGIRCQVAFVPFNSALKEAGEVTTRWPVAADQWHAFEPFYIKEGDDCLDRIQAAAKSSLTDDEKFRKATIEMMLILYETVTKLRNSAETRKVKSDVATNLYFFSEGAVHLVSLVNRVYFGGMRNAFEDSKKLANLPPDYQKLIEIALGEVETDAETRYNAALNLWENIKTWTAEQGIEWETRSELTLPKKKEA